MIYRIISAANDPLSVMASAQNDRFKMRLVISKKISLILNSAQEKLVDMYPKGPLFSNRA